MWRPIARRPVFEAVEPFYPPTKANTLPHPETRLLPPLTGLTGHFLIGGEEQRWVWEGKFGSEGLLMYPSPIKIPPPHNMTVYFPYQKRIIS